MYLRHPWCAPPLAQTFPQLAQHVVERGALTHSHDSERSSLCSQRGSLSALSSLRSARSHDFALLASRTRAPLMGGQHHPKECPAQPQPAGLAAHRPQSPYESGVSRHREVARAQRQKIQKTQRIEDPYPPLPPPAQCQKFRGRRFFGAGLSVAAPVAKRGRACEAWPRTGVALRSSSRCH